MALFGRRRREAEETAPEPAAEAVDGVATPDDGEAGDGEATDGEATLSPEAVPAGERGPWDVADADDRPGRVDLGALRIPGRNGMALRMELDRQSKRVMAANVTIGQSNLQLQAFAAPRTAGIWDEIRGQIAAQITAQGGSVQEAKGPFGAELLALLPVRDQAGNVARRPARFLGVDGPRWFLRGVLTGAALADRAAATQMEQYFSEVVVVRGSEAKPPSELLTLTMPGRPAPAEPAPAQPDLLRRGPEITEVR